MTIEHRVLIKCDGRDCKQEVSLDCRRHVSDEVGFEAAMKKGWGGLAWHRRGAPRQQFCPACWAKLAPLVRDEAKESE